jgi:NAD(P)H-dependent FMN reductase
MTAPAGRVLCLCGSLRRLSSNTAALQAAQQLAPATLKLVLYDGLGSLPLFNPDDEADAVPASVQALREAVGRADALLIACPEYAHGVPGAFKNLLDWLVGSLEFPGKPILLLNTAARGSYHAQEALAEILTTMSAQLLTSQPVPVALPGAGCTAAQVLASAERCTELCTALDVLLTEIPFGPS